MALKSIGDFEILEALGRGATAQVYRALNKQTGQEAALKVFHPGLWDQSTFRRRALEEYRTVSTLNHPNIVKIFEPIWESDSPAIAMEYIAGSSLETFQSRLPYILPELGLLIVREVLRALSHAHELGVTHRDLKPGNILISHAGHVYVSDFGLAKMADVTRFTLSGAVLGSPDFMAPEQARGDVSTPRSDLFSVAAVLYFLVTGTRPFTRNSPLATLAAVIETRYEPVQKRNPKISLPLAKIIHRGLSSSLEGRESRYQSAQEFIDTIDHYLNEIGLAELDLKTWVDASSETTMSALQTISEALINQSEKALQQRNWPLALEKISHLSIVAPESAALTRLRDTYSHYYSRQRWRRSFSPLLGAAFLTSFLLLFLGRSTWLTETSEIKVSAVQKEILGEVHFKVPKGVRVFWDEVEVNPQSVLKKVKPGTHQMRLVKAGLPPIREKIEVLVEEPTIIQVR